MARSTFVVYPGAVKTIVKTDGRTDAFIRMKCEELVAAAKVIFELQEKHDNEWRLSETTPPKYIASFGVRRVASDTVTYQAYNDDPAVHLVEYGAHPGGDPETFVLRYLPLNRAAAIVGGAF